MLRKIYEELKLIRQELQEIKKEIKRIHWFGNAHEPMENYIPRSKENEDKKKEEKLK